MNTANNTNYLSTVIFMKTKQMQIWERDLGNESQLKQPVKKTKWCYSSFALLKKIYAQKKTLIKYSIVLSISSDDQTYIF